MVFTVRGTGLREAEAQDGSPSQAAELVINYVTTTAATFQIATPEDDLEEYLPGANQTKTPGTFDVGSSDLELGNETANNVDPQLVGMRFTNVTLPAGAVVTNAYIQFTVDAIAKNTDPANLIVKAENAASPAAFNPNAPFNISSRSYLGDSVLWTIPAGSWTAAGQAGPDQRTPDLSALVQTLVDQGGWVSGSSMVFTVRGTGLREAEAHDGSPSQAAKLVVNFAPVSSSTFQIATPEDDLEEYLPGANQTKTPGSFDVGSSDLELGCESANNVDPQLVGMRFTNVALPAGAVITNAYIQFTVDAIAKNTDPANLIVKAENAASPAAFNPNVPFNISSRSYLGDSVLWTIPAGSWTAAGQAGADQRTPDLTSLVQALVNQGGWAAGNAMVFTVRGTGLREAEAQDGSPSQAAKLVVTYLSSEPTGNPTTDYPVPAESSWSYLDNGTFPGATWTSLNFNDTTWAFGSGVLGYGEDNLGTEVSFGGNAASKHITTYFRKRISIPDVAVLTPFVELKLRSDDGTVVYVNGTEVARTNLPTGAVTNTTLASSQVEGEAELPYFVYDVPAASFVNGENIIAVEVHQASASSSDLLFDLALNNRQYTSNAPAIGCTSPNDDHISCFTSVIPREQNDTIAIPADHVFQYLFESGIPYQNGGGTVPTNFDFTGYVPVNGSSRDGYLSVNHELAPGGVSILDISLDNPSGLWVKDSSRAVNFSEVVLTAANCSGTVTPWNTVVSCEEVDAGYTTDANADGYIDLGWCVEIDPATKKVRDYGTGTAQKLWALGRMSHENVVVQSDRKTVYFGEDAPDGSVYKFV
ncbi:MAG: DUF839 domain-containing protein, partial [Bacteroidetes bacterium]